MRSSNVIALLGGAALATIAGAASPHALTAAALPHFTGGPLPPGAGLNLPRNRSVEPGIAVDGSGTLWIGSNLSPAAHDDPRVPQSALFSPQGPLTGSPLTGEDIWRSSDGGRTYQWVADPFNVAQNQPGIGGSDSDIAAAPEKNGSGAYNVYAASLWLGNSSLAISQDGGATWTVDPLGGLPGEDRPWIAADGACTVYLLYHQIPSFVPAVNRYDVCGTPGAAVGSALDPVGSSQLFLANALPGGTNTSGKLAVDTSAHSPHRHNVYVPMMGCNLSSPVQQPASAVQLCSTQGQVFVGVSGDGGQTWKDYLVAVDSNAAEPIWPASVATDAAGTVYVAWTDQLVVHLARSLDGGQTWSSPTVVNAAPSLAGVYPTVAAGAAGVVEVAWYGTNRSGDANDASVMGQPSSRSGAPWSVYWARSSDGGRSFVQEAVSAVVHRGVLCTLGSGCITPNSRNLADDFGMVVSPVTGRASIAYTSDQPSGNAADDFTGFASETGANGHGAGPNRHDAGGAASLGVPSAVQSTTSPVLPGGAAHSRVDAATPASSPSATFGQGTARPVSLGALVAILSIVVLTRGLRRSRPRRPGSYREMFAPETMTARRSPGCGT